MEEIVTRMISLTPPNREYLGELLEAWRDTPLSYSHRGGVESPPERGFIVDEHRVCLGSGAETFSTACHALDGWRMFPAWAEVRRLRDQHPMAGDIVAMQVRICGLWWVNPCRVLRRCDSAGRHGFVYSTLPEHAECGEEMFAIEQQADGSVWYVIWAFSRPRHWMAWAGFPLARWWQCRFVRDSQRRMKEICS